MKQTTRQIIATLLCVATLALGLQASAVRADIITTGTALAAEPAEQDRQALLDLFARDDVQAQLVELGVDPAFAAERVQHLTSAELAQLQANMAAQPAGGSVVGVAVIVLLTLVFLDIFGVTDIFTFIKPAK